MGLRQAYKLRQITNIQWIDGDSNLADTITKSKANGALERLISTNSINLRPIGQVDRSGIRTPITTDNIDAHIDIKSTGDIDVKSTNFQSRSSVGLLANWLANWDPTNGVAQCPDQGMPLVGVDPDTNSVSGA